MASVLKLRSKDSDAASMRAWSKKLPAFSSTSCSSTCEPRAPGGAEATAQGGAAAAAATRALRVRLIQ